MNLVLGLMFLLSGSMDDADRLFEERRFAEARAAYEALLPGLDGADRARVLTRVGEACASLGDQWAAEGALAEAVALEETAERRLKRGENLYFIGQRVASEPGVLAAEVQALMNDAAREIRRALELSPDSAEAHVYAGLCHRYLDARDLEEAAYRRALELEPGRADAALYLAYLLETRGQADEARAVLGAVPAEARGAAHHLALGRLALRTGDLAEARVAGRRAIAAAPEDPEGYQTVWNATAFRKRFSAFEEDMAAVLAEDPERFLAHYFLGFCRRDAGRPRESVESFLAAARLRPSETRARLLAGEVLREDLRDTAGATTEYLAVLEADPSDARAREVLASLAFDRSQAGDAAEARRLLEALRRADPSEWSHTTNLALLERDAGHLDEALRLYEEAEAAFPFEPQIPNDRGLLLMGLGRRDEAIAAFRRALEQDPLFLDGLENMGAYAWLEGRAEEARGWFLRAYERARVVGGEIGKFRRYLDEVSREIRR